MLDWRVGDRQRKRGRRLWDFFISPVDDHHLLVCKHQLLFFIRHKLKRAQLQLRMTIKDLFSLATRSPCLPDGVKDYHVWQPVSRVCLAETIPLRTRPLYSLYGARSALQLRIVTIDPVSSL